MRGPRVGEVPGGPLEDERGQLGVCGGWAGKCEGGEGRGLGVVVGHQRPRLGGPLPCLAGPRPGWPTDGGPRSQDSWSNRRKSIEKFLGM